MNSKYRIKLFVVLLVFAIVVTFSIATIDYFRLKEQTIKDNENQIEHITDSVKNALKTFDKAYLYLDGETTEKMAKYTFSLQEKYEENPDFNTWDFDALSTSMKMDIHIIDAENTIVYSNDAQEVGLDFSACCASFDKLLTERRDSGELFVDGIDIMQKSGEVNKFSYMATEDKKFIIELSYSLENEPIYKEFGFIPLTDQLLEDFSLLEGLHVLNYGGLQFGDSKGEKLPPERLNAFKIARDSNEIVEIDSEYNGKESFIRYIPYLSTDDTGSMQSKIVEIAYNKRELLNLLKENQKSYYMQLAIILVVTLIFSSMISSWFAKPIHLAYHDSLTGLKNRASFDDQLKKALTDHKGQTALLMMDLDNFKLVNDFFGHIKGDYLLKIIAQTMKASAGSEYETFRLGGDEFAIIMKNVQKDEAENLAQYIIDMIRTRIQKEKDINTLSVSLSIGIVLAEKNDTPRDLYKHADIALYESKEKGKNQYQLYKDGAAPDIPFTS